MSIPDDKRAELRAKHPGAIVCTTPRGVFALRLPTEVEYIRFKAAAISDKLKSTAVDQLVRQCVVYPDAAGFEAARAQAPALPDMLGERLLEAAGATMEVMVEGI